MAGEVHSARPLTDAIIALLQAAGLTVGDSVAPASLAAGATGADGYVVVYPLIGGVTDGPIDGPDEDVNPIYQLTSVGKTRQQAEWVADKARTAMLGVVPLFTGGRNVALVKVDMVGGIQRDDDAQPPLFYSPDRYRFWVTPTVI